MFTGETNQEYGLRIVTGMFGTGKTKNVFQEAYFWKKKNPDGLLIANIPYDFVDIHFDSKRDLNIILSHIMAYIQATNTIEDMKEAIFPPIKLIVDELHVYYFARDFKNFDKEVMTIMTQCRKRRISMDFISQELAQTDIFIRRLSPLVLCYENFLLGFKKAVLYYARKTDATDLNEEKAFDVVDTTWQYPNRLVSLFNPSLKHYFSQKYLTYYVVGFTDLLSDSHGNITFTFEDFKKKQLDLYQKHGYLFLKDTLNDYKFDDTTFFPEVLRPDQEMDIYSRHSKDSQETSKD